MILWQHTIQFDAILYIINKIKQIEKHKMLKLRHNATFINQ